MDATQPTQRGASPARKAIPIVTPYPFGAESYLTAEISASAIRHNLGQLRQRLAPATKLCAVVKADCYGHGQDQLLNLIATAADGLGVATPEEAIHLRTRGYDGPVLVFFSACAYAEGKQLRQALAELVARRITLTVAGEPDLRALSEAASRVDSPADVHLKVDTGMTRSGVLHDQADALIDRLRSEPGIRLSGLYTHFATADEPDSSFARLQLDRLIDLVRRTGCDDLTLHAANSAALMDLPESHLDMVRPGIAMYGYLPSPAIRNPLDLRPSLRLTGRLMQVKDIPAGSSCGYGLTYRFTRDSRVGLVPVGYGDGYPRCLSNQSVMSVRGREVPVRGRIAMDQTLIDLTDVPAARVGDEVEIISASPEAANSVTALASLAGTIPYEITCMLGLRVRRVLVD